MVAPIMRGIMSRMTPPDKQGKLKEFFLQIDSFCETGQLVNIHACIYRLLGQLLWITSFLFP